jgi:hypothetical protein
VYTVITRSRSGLSIAQLQRKRTWPAPARNALYKLTKKGLFTPNRAGST